MDIQIDLGNLEDVQQRLGELSRKTPNVVSAALNRAVTNIATNINKGVRKEYTIKAADVKSVLKKTTANPKSLKGAVTASGKVIPIDKFKTTKMLTTSRKGGVKSVSFNKKTFKASVKSSGLKPIATAFITNLNGAKVFKREGKKRLPISRVMGPSIPQMIGNEGIAPHVQSEGQAMFDRRIEVGINHLLNSLGGH